MPLNMRRHNIKRNEWIECTFNRLMKKHEKVLKNSYIQDQQTNEFFQLQRRKKSNPNGRLPVAAIIYQTHATCDKLELNNAEYYFWKRKHKMARNWISSPSSPTLPETGDTSLLRWHFIRIHSYLLHLLADACRKFQYTNISQVIVIAMNKSREEACEVSFKIYTI